MRQEAVRILRQTLALVLLAGGATSSGQEVTVKDAIATLEKELGAPYGEAERGRLARGIRQAADLWQPRDGDAAAFQAFVRANFAADGATLDTMFGRFERLLEQLDGHMNKLTLEFKRQADLDLGPILPLDEVFAGYDPGAHIADDFFQNKLAFTVLLNFPVTTLEQRLAEGASWTRRQWAETRLAYRFSKRVPAEVYQEVAEASAAADQYIAEYNIWMHHVLTPAGERLFPPKLRLLSHWNLRDELKANYAEPGGLAKQRMIQLVMERIVTQTIPAVVINNPCVDWNPATNEVAAAAVRDAEEPAPVAATVSNAPEPDTRYAMILKTFNAAKKTDPFSPTAPTHIARRFNEDRQIPEERARGMLEQVVSSPLVSATAKLISARLGRPLEPFDIWYSGFRPQSTRPEAELDAIVTKRYPTAEAYARDMPNLLMKLGFSRERARYLADAIEIDPSRGSGHAWGPAMRSEKAHLRTRVGKTGMNYKGFNIAAHEMGHNVEQILSLHPIDHTLLSGVPNTAFTEAIAFVFQRRDLELLGLARPDPKDEAFGTLNDFWATYEIAGVALVDMGVWHWMYDHPAASPAELKQATLSIARDVWNRYYAPVFGTKDVVLLAIYSHMVSNFLYLPDYPLGHLIAHQIEERLKKAGSVGPEIERMVHAGSITPDLWMENATGAPLGADALLAATKRALDEVGK
jgi:hypothetical protein